AVERFQAVWRKGYERDRDAYAVTAQHPGMTQLYRAEGIDAVVVCGLATNICCFFAAKDFRSAGFRVLIAEDAAAGIDVPAAGLRSVPLLNSNSNSWRWTSTEARQPRPRRSGW